MCGVLCVVVCVGVWICVVVGVVSVFGVQVCVGGAFV